MSCSLGNQNHNPRKTDNGLFLTTPSEAELSCGGLQRDVLFIDIKGGLDEGWHEVGVVL